MVSERFWKTTRSKMNRQTYSILFCVLFASTFVHEIRAKAWSNPEFSQVQSTPKPSTGSGEVDINLNITVTTPNVLSIRNDEDKAYLLIDVKANIAILINGKTGIAVIIDVRTKGVLYIKNIDVEDFLYACEKDLEDALRLVDDCITDVTDEVLRAINDVVRCLIGNIRVELKANIRLGLELIIDISRELIEILNGDLNGLLKLIEDVVISTEKDLAGLYNFLLGLGQCIGSVRGGIATVAARLNLQVLLSLDRGIEVLIALIDQLGEHARALTFFNDVEQYFFVTALLGGLENDRVTKVLAVIVRFIKGKDSLEVVITALIEFLARWSNSKPVPDIANMIHKMLLSLRSLLEKLCITSELRGLVTIINSELDKTLRFDGVDLSAILTLLHKAIAGTASSPLEILVGVLIQLKPIVTNEVAIVRGLLTLLFQLTSTIGRQLHRALGFVVDSILGLVDGVIAHLLELAGDIVDLLLENLWEALLKIPIIGDIVRLYADVIRSVTSEEIDLEVILNIPTHRVLILGLIQVETGFPLKITANIILQIKILLESCTSISVYIDFYPDVVRSPKCIV